MNIFRFGKVVASGHLFPEVFEPSEVFGQMIITEIIAKLLKTEEVSLNLYHDYYIITLNIPSDKKAKEFHFFCFLQLSCVLSEVLRFS